MNPKVKKLWIEALRSGKYEQGRGMLHLGNRFCCLGVLCDLHREVVPGLDWVHQCGYATYDAHSAALPPSVAAWAGVSVSPKLNKSGQTYLSTINDGGSHTFSQIADEIEKHL